MGRRGTLRDPRYLVERPQRQQATLLERLFGGSSSDKVRGGRGSYALVGSPTSDSAGGDGSDAGGDDEEEEEEGMEVDIPEDAYGSAILAIVRDLPFVFARSGPGLVNVFSCVFGIGVLIINCILQGAILFYIHEYVVKPDIKHVQDRFADYHSKVEDGGSFQPDRWDEYSNKEELCAIAMWNRPFYYAVLFCWTLAVMSEMFASFKLFSDIWSLPSVRKYEAMFTDKDDAPFIVGIQNYLRLAVFVMVCTPKLVISLSLLWLGCEWLSATIAFESLVSNTVAMTFVVNIDELLYDALIPTVHRKDVEDINFMYFRQLEGVSEEDVKLQSFWRSTFSVIASMAFIVIYAEIIQDVLPDDVFNLKLICVPVLLDGPQPTRFGLNGMWQELIGGPMPTLQGMQ